MDKGTELRHATHGNINRDNVITPTLKTPTVITPTLNTPTVITPTLITTTNFIIETNCDCGETDGIQNMVGCEWTKGIKKCNTWKHKSG